MNYLEVIGISRELLEAALAVDIATFKRVRSQLMPVPTHSFVPNVRWCRPCFPIPSPNKTQAGAIRAVIEDILTGKSPKTERTVDIKNGRNLLRRYWVTPLESTPTGARFRITRCAFRPGLRFDKQNNVELRDQTTQNATTIEAHFEK